MLQLRFESHPIQLNYDLQNAKVERKTTLPNVEIQTISPRLSIRQPRGELTIDSTEYYYSIGKKNIADFSRDYAQLGRQAALQAIADTVEEGNRLAQITNPSNVIADLAFESRFKIKGELSWEPITAPRVHYQANPAQIEVIPGKVDYTPHDAINDTRYIPGKVDIQVGQYPRLDISVVDIKI